MNKEDSLRQPNQPLDFWLYAGILAVLLASTWVREINRPFYGLHAWAQASGAWAARSHAKYGLAYTKGMSTWAVGDPPPKNPARYMDHPQLNCLIAGAFMAILGISEWATRIPGILISLATFLLFLKILRGLLDDRTTLLAGLLYALFPLTAYFGLGGWGTLLSFSALWCYLVLTGSVSPPLRPSFIHKFGLAASLFMSLQFGWEGFFYAFAIGLHYVCRCIRRKQMPDKTLLAILVIAPLSSLALNFIIMAGGYNWDVSKIVKLYKWRAAMGETDQTAEKFLWGAWLAKFWEHAMTNFTLPVLITAIGYLTFGQLLIFTQPKPARKEARRPRQFPQFWLFVITPMSQLLILKGSLWRHQTWEMPFGPLVAISVALAIMLLADILTKIHRRLAVACVVTLLTVFFVFCAMGTNYYYAVRWQPEAKIEMFKTLNKAIPPDKALLSYEDFIVNQHSSKGGFYRPEIAWYLDREITPARTFEEVQRYAATGRYPYYLVPYVAPVAAAEELTLLVNQLKNRYGYQYVPGVPGAKTEDDKFLRAGMTSYLIFDLKSKAPN